MTGRLVLTAIVSFAGVGVLTPLAGRLAHRLGLLDVPKSERSHRQPTPYLGGVAILVGILAGVVLVRTAVEVELERQLVVILLCGAALGLVGLWDDIHPRPPKWRLLIECAAAIAVVAVDVRLRVTPWVWSNVVVTVIWIVGITNAMNLLDNMDGLASGTVAIAATGSAYLGLANEQRLVPIMGVALAGASLGFLLHNRPPARIFMGDAGSLSLGFLLAVTIAKLDLVASPGPLRIAVVVLLSGVGILDTVLVVTSRLRRHVSPFVGGTDHSSHRLVRSGLSPGRAVLTLHAMSAWFVASGIMIRYASSAIAVAGALVTILVVGATLWALLRLPAEDSTSEEQSLSSET